MKTKFNGFLTLILVLLVQITFAQEKTVSGAVSDANGPLPGVSVLVKGTSTGTQTDFDGKYTIKAETGATIQFSYVGYKTVEKVVGASNSIDVTMVQSSEMLDEVVVTALGIKRDEKSLGYSTQKVGGDDINTAKKNNFVDGLSGKVAGVQIKRSTNLGGSTNVIIRGITSLTGNNQALFVIDGVPVDNSNTNGGGQKTARGGYDFGNAASDINPDDIESVNVLKGAAASALYGSRAANGVIMITTKKGAKNGKKFNITVNSSITTGTIDKSTFPKYQWEYGGGYGPFYSGGSYPGLLEYDLDGDGTDDLVVPTTEDASYGTKFDPSLMVYQWNSFDPEMPLYRQKTPWVAAKNGPSTFFNTAVTAVNTLSINGNTENGNYRFSYTNFDQNGIMPNSTLGKDNFSFTGSFDLNDKLTVSGSANYIKTKAVGRNLTGYSDNILTSFRQWFQVNVDIQEQRDAYFRTRRNVTWNYNSDTNLTPIYWDNPYWQRYENFENDNRNRFIGNMALRYNVTDWFNVYGRVSVDTYNEMQETRIAVGSLNPSRYTRFNRDFTEYNYDLMLNFDKNLTDDLNLKGVLGTNIRRNIVNSIYAQTNGGLVVPGLYALSNSLNNIEAPSEYAGRVGVNGYYANLSFGYKDFLYLDLTGRNDVSSTLPDGNNSYFYSSVSSSLVFSKLVDADWLSFGKVRLNYAEVGNDAPFNSIADSYVKPTPFGTTTLFSVSSTRKNPNLKPEQTASWEAGLQMKFLQNRIGFDFSYYKTNTKNQIVPVATSGSIGVTNKFVNAGEIENKGIEVSLNAVPLKTENFSWTMDVNFSRNRNKVLSLFEGVDNLVLGTFQGGVSLNAAVGEPYGIIRGRDFVYLNGQRVIENDPSLSSTRRGVYQRSAGSAEKIGDVNPDYNAGISNMFKYKNLSLSFLIDIQKGGDLFSLDQWYGQGTGLYDNTAGLNELGNPIRNSIANGGGVLLQGVNPDGSVNTTRGRMDLYANPFGWARAPQALHVYDGSYVKLREVAITYALPSKVLENSFFNSVQFSLTGSNLWIIHKNLPYADPETGLSSGNLQGYQSGVQPTTKDIGFNVKLQF
ncbi:MAG: SusC/RagA family TonB-linked outer membrane protein [Lutibacter sp.]